MSVATTASGTDDEFEAARQKSELSAEGGEVGKLQYEDGFTWKVFFGALFVTFIMLPGAIYMGLVTGASLGPAAQWVTIVLFTEICRRSYLPLKRQEIYCIWYIAGSIVTTTTTGFVSLPGISGGIFGTLITYQYLLQSPQLAAVASHLPTWIAPHIGSHTYTARTFFDASWTVPFLVLFLASIFDRCTWIGLGYMLFKFTSDVERLPFPLAPVAASGATALAEANIKEESWRWGVFSTGAIVGIVFGIVYLAIPILTNWSVVLLEIPFFDLTPNTGHILPGALIGYNPDLSLVITGFVLPWQIILGTFAGSVLFQIGLNPILYFNHQFPDFVQGSGTIQTSIALNIDFWMSFGIGLQLAIAVIGGFSLVRALMANRGAQSGARGTLVRNLERGDFPWIAAVGAWLVGALGYVILCHRLLSLFPLELLLFYALVFTPLNSYVSARMWGLTGSTISFPYLNQVVVSRSRYAGSDVWFAPMPLNDYGWSAQKFREVELTGTRFTSIIKVELLMLLMVPLASLIYWGFLWHTSAIPSAQFPYAQKMWPIQAVAFAIWTQINAKGGATWMLHAIQPHVIEAGAAVGVGLYLVMMLFKLPLLFFYGFISGATQLPHNVIPLFIGGLLSKYYFAKRFGTERWSLYAPVLLAGFFCGIGLIGMGSIAIALIAKTVNYLPF